MAAPSDLTIDDLNGVWVMVNRDLPFSQLSLAIDVNMLAVSPVLGGYSHCSH